MSAQLEVAPSTGWQHRVHAFRVLEFKLRSPFISSTLVSSNYKPRWFLPETASLAFCSDYWSCGSYSITCGVRPPPSR